MTRCQDPPRWIAAVLRGEFKAIPRHLCWDMSVEFAHLVDGYAVLGGIGPGLATSERVIKDIASTGQTQASALEIWAALFIQHRGYRMSVYGPAPVAEASLDKLCCVLRERLIRASAHEKIRVLTAVAAAQSPLGGARWRT